MQKKTRSLTRKVSVWPASLKNELKLLSTTTPPSAGGGSDCRVGGADGEADELTEPLAEALGLCERLIEDDSDELALELGDTEALPLADGLRLALSEELGEIRGDGLVLEDGEAELD